VTPNAGDNPPLFTTPSTTPSTRTTPATSTIDERYGRTPRRRRRNRLWAYGSAVAFLVLAGVWLLWTGAFQTLSTVDAVDTGNTVVSNSEVTVTWQLTTEPGVRTSCAIQALTEGFSIVGWKIVAIPPSQQRTRILTETVRTSEQSASGLIYQCWRT
jgi:hypothetical protein